MKRLTTFLFLLLTLTAVAQTNFFATYSFVNGFGQVQNVKQVSWTPMSIGKLGAAVVIGDEIPRVIISNSITVPLLSGFGYRVKYFANIQPPIITAMFTNWFPTNIVAGSTVSASDYFGISTNLGNGIYALTKTQADLLYAPIGSISGTFDYNTLSNTPTLGNAASADTNTMTVAHAATADSATSADSATTATFATTAGSAGSATTVTGSQATLIANAVQQDSGGVITDDSNFASIDRNQRLLADGVGNPVLNWSTKQLFGMWYGILMSPQIVATNIIFPMTFGSFTNAGFFVRSEKTTQFGSQYLGFEIWGATNFDSTGTPIGNPTRFLSGYYDPSNNAVATLKLNAHTYVNSDQDGAGNNSTNWGSVQAATFTGNGSSLININATSITGTLTNNITGNASGATNLWGPLNTNQIATLADVLAGTSTSKAVTPATTHYLAQLGMTVEKFGATPWSVGFNFSTTNGVTTVYGADGNFTSADVGKWLCVYYNTSNTNYLFSPIMSVLSTNQVVVSNAPTITATAQEARWGFDDTAAFQAAHDYAISNAIPNIYLTNCCYGFASDPVFRGSNGYGGWNQNIYSVLRLGDESWHKTTTQTNSTFNLIWHGAAYAREDTTGYFGYQRKGLSGTVLFYPGIGTHNGNDYLFSATGTNVGTFSMLNVSFENIKFLHPNYPTMSCIDNTYGGTFRLLGCEITGDWNSFNTLPNSGGVTRGGPTNTFAVRLAINSNNGNQLIQDCEIDGGYNGVYCNDHAYIVNSMIVRFANATLIGNGLPTWFHKVRFDVNATNIYYGCDTGGGSVLFGDCEFSGDAPQTSNNVVWCPTTSYRLYGSLRLSMDKPGMFNHIFGTNLFQDFPYLNLDLYGINYAGTGANGGMNVLSNYYGNTITMSHFPYGVMTASANASAAGRWSTPTVWGGNGWTWGNYGAFYDSQFQQGFYMVPPNGLYFKSTTSPYNTVGFLDQSGNYSISGTFTGDASGAVNINASNITGTFSNGVVVSAITGSSSSLLALKSTNGSSLFEVSSNGAITVSVVSGSGANPLTLPAAGATGDLSLNASGRVNASGFNANIYKDSVSINQMNLRAAGGSAIAFSTNLTVSGNLVATNGLISKSATTNSIGIADTNGTAEILYLYASTNSGTPTLYIHGSGGQRIMGTRDYHVIIGVLVACNIALMIFAVTHCRWHVKRHHRKHFGK